MTLPEMRHFELSDIDGMTPNTYIPSFKTYHVGELDFTFTVNKEPVASCGVFKQSGLWFGWLVLSKDAQKHPRVFWAIKEMTKSVNRFTQKPLYIIVREDWYKANRFAGWLGFEKTKVRNEIGGLWYNIYIRQPEGA